MVEVFNDLVNGFSYFIDVFVNKTFFVSGVSYGWLIIAIAVLGLVIHFLFGRLR